MLSDCMMKPFCFFFISVTKRLLFGETFARRKTYSNQIKGSLYKKIYKAGSLSISMRTFTMKKGR